MIVNDLDIDADRSVVVVERRRGIAESLREQWWDIEIERPTGAADGDTGDTGDASEERDEPRRVTISRASGPVSIP